jgi:single-strand DNA-binding protein
MTEWVNEVVLVGRIAGECTQVDLPSGDEMVKLRIVIPRKRPETKVTVDAIDLMAIKPAIVKKALKLNEGDVVRVEGALRRSFWKTPTGVASRTEVEVSTIAKA